MIRTRFGLGGMVTLTTLLLLLTLEGFQLRDLTGKESSKQTGKLNFDRTIAPLFSAHCLECHHGPGAEAKLDLGSKASTLQGGESGPAVVAGDLKRSLVWRRIEADEMPPKHPLSKADKKVIREWIESGANWGSDPIDPFRYSTSRRAGYDWWSLQPLVEVKIPEIGNNKTDISHPIDHFILSRLIKAGITPSTQADPRTLVRRLYVDLIGLAAPVEVIDRFTKDPSTKAWETLVDELLASHHYGERWARHWLDIVRFGESSGYEYNQPRETAWHYRDWVIQALNNDLPYDQFTRMQLAGDIFQPNTLDGAAAVGMLVAGIHNTVLGASPAMQLAGMHDELEELVGTVSQTFLGLTVNCARCHDHKFDPISMREYYSFAAALAGVNHGERNVPLRNNRIVEMETKKRQRTELHNRLVSLIKARNGSLSSTANQLQTKESLEANTKGISYRISLKIAPSTWASATQATGPEDGVLLNLLKKDGTVLASGSWLPGQWNQGKNAAHFQVKTLDYVGDGSGPIRIQLRPFPENSDRFGGAVDDIKLIQTITGRVVHEESFDGLTQQHPAGSQADTARRVFYGAKSDRWIHSGINAIHAVEHANGNLAIQLYSGSGPEIHPRPETDEERSLQSQIQKLDTEIRGITVSSTAKVYSVISGNPGVMHLYQRGDVKRPGEEVQPDGLKAIQALPASFHLDKTASDAKRRQGLADWITHPDNSLFHRVIVNRVWQYHFGSGLLLSPNDFGFNGGMPSHPELLDYLAVWFRQNGYSLKKLHKLITTSRTYQQASQGPSDAEKTDRDNRYLWRQNPRRVEAEVLRDSILDCAGVLHRVPLGPPFRDVRVEQVPPTNYYIPIDPLDRETNRRTIYRWHVRGQRNALLDTFDCPDPSVKTPQRTISTTPSQALSQWNDSFVLRMSHQLANRIENDVGSKKSLGQTEESVTKQQVDRAWQLVLGRLPAANEKSKATGLVQQHGLPLLCRVLLNSNEFIFID